MAYTPSSSGSMGSWALASALSAMIVPANEYRDKLVVQMRSGNPVSIAFNEDAVALDGVQLRIAGSVIIVTGALARSAVYGICPTSDGTGGYQENLGVCD